jgi:hypothetical protein
MDSEYRVLPESSEWDTLLLVKFTLSAPTYVCLRENAHLIEQKLTAIECRKLE